MGAGDKAKGAAGKAGAGAAAIKQDVAEDEEERRGRGGPRGGRRGDAHDEEVLLHRLSARACGQDAKQRRTVSRAVTVRPCALVEWKGLSSTWGEERAIRCCVEAFV